MKRERVVAYAKAYFFMYGIPAISIVVMGAMILSLWSFASDDLSMFYFSSHGICQNIAGYAGASFAAFMVYLFGTAAYLFIPLLMYLMFFCIRKQTIEQDADRLVGFGLLIISFAMLCNVSYIGFSQYSEFGGIVGDFIITTLLSAFSRKAQVFIIYNLLFSALVLVARYSHIMVAKFLISVVHAVIYYLIQLDHMPARMIRWIAQFIAALSTAIYVVLKSSYQILNGHFVKNLKSSIVEFERDEPVDKKVDQILQELFGKEIVVPVIEQQKVHQDTIAQEVSSDVKKVMKYHLPDVEEMLSHGTLIFQKESKVESSKLDSQALVLEEKLSQFGIKGSVVRVHPGPVITLYEYRPDSHIKLSKIVALEDDLSMALQAVSIRILAPIPGKSVVGFEVANKVRKPVLLSDIFHSKSWTRFSGNLPLILGEDTLGSHMVVDLATMPHVLIAGSTGSGKSVALNCMLVSLLCAKTPEEMRLIIIDPKQIEFTAYEDIAHLLFPIVTDSKRAIPVLKWVVLTMEERYEQMSALGVRNIFEYQKLAKEDHSLKPMPFIVVIIDELADLMMTTGKDAEDLIARIAQMSRAAGIHMIVATQRPSVDVITGLIKVNFPNRISFKVTSKVDSRTILDEVGAERLLGKGDMLFIDAKDPEIKRVHGAYVSDSEIKFLVNHIRAQREVQYCEVADKLIDMADVDSLILENDQKLYQDVVALLRTCDEISISMIQRRFRIGYNRSARIIEALEANGLILPGDGSKMRRVVKE